MAILINNSSQTETNLNTIGILAAPIIVHLNKFTYEYSGSHCNVVTITLESKFIFEGVERIIYKEFQVDFDKPGEIKITLRETSNGVTTSDSVNKSITIDPSIGKKGLNMAGAHVYNHNNGIGNNNNLDIFLNSKIDRRASIFDSTKFVDDPATLESRYYSEFTSDLDFRYVTIKSLFNDLFKALEINDPYILNLNIIGNCLIGKLVNCTNGNESDKYFVESGNNLTVYNNSSASFDISTSKGREKAWEYFLTDRAKSIKTNFFDDIYPRLINTLPSQYFFGLSQDETQNKTIEWTLGIDPDERGSRPIHDWVRENPKDFVRIDAQKDFELDTTGGYQKYRTVTANDAIRESASGYEPFRQSFFYKFIEPQSASANDLSDIDFFKTVRNLDMLRLRRFSFNAGSTFLWDDRGFELGILYDTNKHDYDHDDTDYTESHKDANEGIMNKLIPHLKKIIQAGCLGPSGRYKKIVVEGHTDTVNNSTDNQTLSVNRANDIRNAIISKLTAEGINNVSSLIVAIGRGETQLKIDTGDNVDEERNRRVEILFKK